MSAFTRHTAMPTLTTSKNAKTNSRSETQPLATRRSPLPTGEGVPGAGWGRAAGFTLVEILVVIGITAVLFFLLLGPLVNSFRLTQRAQMLVAAQDSARRTLETLTRELGSAAYVFDNASHPFSGQMAAASAQYAQSIPDQFSNFLDIDVPVNPDPTANPGYNSAMPTVPAHAYNAKLDFVLARHNSAGQIGSIDPTTGSPFKDSNGNIEYGGDPVTIQNGSAVPTGLTFPLAPGTSMVRYWVGRRDPTKPYATHGEGGLLARNGNNTYILYRAQFSPNTLTTDVNGKATSAINGNLFATGMKTDPVTHQTVPFPEFDDPDFFRNVTAGQDINWLSTDHHLFTAEETYGVNEGGTLTNPAVGSHNYRVQQWMQIAKAVISSPNTDLLLLPHNRDNSINYSALPDIPNVSGSGERVDMVAGGTQLFPVVNTSVTFQFASVSGNASAATNTDYAGAGYGSFADANNGLPFVPSVYTANAQSWAFPYHISLYQYTNTTQPLFETAVASMTDTVAMYNAGDLMEMYNDTSSMTEVPVYDVTTGAPVASTTYARDYVPMVVNPDNATINFDLPALPTPANAYNRFWQIPAADFTDTNGTYPNPSLPAETAAGVLDLTNTTVFPNSPLAGVANAHIVPGSVRVYGPDGTPGPNLGQSVLYTEAFPGSGNFGANQYVINYGTSTLTLYVDPGTNQLPQAAGGQAAPVNIAFDYQSNLAPSDPAQAVSAQNPASPLLVKVDYHTRDLLDINLGVRVYDPNNVGPAQIVTVHNQVRIGNSNR